MLSMINLVLKRKKASELYSPEFFARQQGGSRASADVIAPLVLSETGARSVVDVGCGVGAWAAAFVTCGCSVIGLDGEYVGRDALHIPNDLFRPIDLNHPPLDHNIGTFDLAVSLEVAEHLDPANEDRFFDFLVSLAPNILFSAAIPGQGGKGHINEQWQSHWISNFRERGFACHDTVRLSVWDDDKVRPWYAQNTFLFVKGGEPIASSLPFDVVHPKTFMRTHKHRKRLFSK